MVRSIRLAGVGLLVCAAISTVGCGGRGSVSGTVKHKNGKPVMSGIVNLIASDNMPYSTTINRDGSYTVLDVPAGPAKIGVISPNPSPNAGAGGRAGGRTRASGQNTLAKDKGARGGTATTPPPAPEELVKGWFPIKDSYADPQASGLEVTVQSGSQTPYNIEVE